MAKTRDTGFLVNVINVDQNGNVAIVSGSRTLLSVSSSGAVTTTGVISGSNAANAALLDGTGSLAFATTSSFATTSGSVSSRITQIERVYATTGSNSFTANQSITGSLTVSSTLTAQTLVVQTITSSILYTSGSNVFGCDINSRQTFTGSVFITGSNLNATVGNACFSGTVCGLNLISRCNIRVGVDGGYSIISGPTTGAAISIGSNSSTFDRNLSLGLIAGDLSTYSPVLTINAQTSNVGIGNCTPDRRFYVADTSATQSTILGYNQCTTFCGTVIEAITDRTSNSAFNLMNLKSSTSPMFTVRGDGLVGINDSCPSTSVGGAGLSVKGSSYIQLAVKSTATSAGIEFIPSSGINWEVQANNGAGGCKFFVYDRTNSAYRFLIDSTGNIGIGTFSPATTSGKGIHIYSTNGHANLSLESCTSGVKWEILSTTGCNFVVYQANAAMDRFTINPSGIATFGCNICVAKYIHVGSQGGSDVVFLGGGSGVGATIEARYADGNPNVHFAGNGNSWINRTYGSVGIGTCTPNYLLDVNGAINSSAGTMYSNSVVTYAVGGTMAGNTATYFDFPTWNDTDQGQMFEIKAFFDHFYNWNYGTHYYVYLTSRATSSQPLTMFNCTTGNGGSWMAYKPNATTLRVCKIAGTYGGGGAYWVQVTAKQP